jgi:hypothetical protein
VKVGFANGTAQAPMFPLMIAPRRPLSVPRRALPQVTEYSWASLDEGVLRTFVCQQHGAER